MTQLAINGERLKVPSDSFMTGLQEKASLAVIKAGFLNKAKFTKAEIMDVEFDKNGDPIRPTKAQKAIFEEMPPEYMKDYEWLDNFYKQQEKFFGVRFGNHTVSPAAGGYQEFDRDNAGGFMEYITKLVKDNYGIARKDVWNPADIWLIWNPREAKQEIELAVSKHIGIKYLNDVLRTML
ncbi:uncharacterized protein METZ01_LOCUS421332, partial [marine metagenome]